VEGYHQGEVGVPAKAILSALFAERREYEMILEDRNRRLQLALAQREEAERTLSDRNTQLVLAAIAALVGS
jgi:phosphoglycerate-specific signal transduction histidine kinase